MAKENSKIMVVDDDFNVRTMVCTVLQRSGYVVSSYDSPEKALGKIAEFAPNLIISDYKMNGMSGLDFLKKIRETNITVPFIIITAYATIETAVEAMKYGATDYLQKGDTALVSELKIKVEKALELGELRQENQNLKKHILDTNPSVGKTDIMNSMSETIKTVAKSKSTVLIHGESGTGKELVSREIHFNSPRAGKKFVKVNCAAIPDTLIESELFGHEKGSFTGALKQQKGRFEQANGGTILLDEISEMPLGTQAKILRVLQEKEVLRIGAEEPIFVDVRILATTNRDLLKYVEEGSFREDLYYRLNVVPIKTPSLKERKDDIKLLVEHFIGKYNDENGYSVTGLEDGGMDILLKHDWPGNVRELENAIERAVVLTCSGLVKKENLLSLSKKTSSSKKGLSAGKSVSEVEKELIFVTLDACAGNKTKAAEMLGISIRTLRNKLNEYANGQVEASE